jgi:hypothetical protein
MDSADIFQIVSIVLVAVAVLLTIVTTILKCYKGTAEDRLKALEEGLEELKTVLESPTVKDLINQQTT